ncbi:MAG TPA: serine O-acetyltransferase [Aggregatilineales bacterium]|nr:serine O-acetyltransferase [Aggregatilineales bacterium]
MFDMLRRDIKVFMERDPAARSGLEIVLLYQGLHAIWAHRVAHWLWSHGLKLLGRMVSQISRFITGIEIHPGAQIGPGFFIDHGMGIVIGETSVVGEDCSLYHGVTLGGTKFERGKKRHPTLEDRVVVGAGAKILGDIVIGSDSRIGANAVVVKPVPANSVVVGVPGQVVQRSLPRPAMPDLEHGRLPDTIGATVVSLMQRVEALEEIVENGGRPEPVPHRPVEQVWQGQDFQI